MSTPTLIGFPQSTYVWTARAALNHKGVEHEFGMIMPPANRKPEHLELHPWGKVPVLRHDDVTLFETTAILEYIEGSFEGPALFPRGVRERARVVQLLSIANAYLYPAAVERCALQYIFPRGENGQPERATIEAAVPDIERALTQLEGMLGDRQWFVGDAPSAADFYLGPLIAVCGMFPESKAPLGTCPNLARLLGQLMQIPAFASAAPPAPKG